jgi:Dna[CI] antecedent, DciA
LRPLRHILAAEPALARWLERQRCEHGALRCIRRALPPALAAHVQAVEAGSPQLVVVATSGAAAALLRQRVPALLEALAREGSQSTGIRIRVQLRSATRHPEKNVPKQIDPASARKLEALAHALADSALRQALLRLAEGKRAASGTEQPPDRVNQQRAGEKQDRVLDDLADES